jgi:ribonucleoside-diphosphate reductase alpha chain
MEAPLQFYKKFNPRAVETSVWSANGTDEVITFCVEVPEEARTKNDLSAIQLLEHVKLTQMNWVEAGTVVERCVQPWLRHNVSNTINVRPDEWDAVEEYIYENRQYFAGISLLPQSGDLDYPQAPMCAVRTPDEIVKEYGEGSLMASGLVVDGLHAFGNNLWKACETALGLGQLSMPEKPVPTKIVANAANWVGNRTGGLVKRFARFVVTNADRNYHDQVVKYVNDVEEFILKTDWIRRAEQFARRYFAGDVRRMTYCLKEVNNWKLWVDLKREYIEVDYTTMIEDTDTTKIQETIACAGGKCDIL